MISACALSAKATASEVCIPLTTRIAAPAPICVAAPAGAIGSAADAAEAQRNTSASEAEAGEPSPSACRSTNRATPRNTQEIETNAQAFIASRGQAQCSCTQWARRKRTRRPVRASLGSASTSAAAATPAAATRINPARNQPEAPETPAAIAESGVSAAVSTRPSRTSERPIAPTPVVLPG